MPGIYMIIMFTSVLSSLFFCGNENSTRPQYVITMDTTTFVPETALVRTGTQVYWINKDVFAHTVVSGFPEHPDNKFGSNFIIPGDTFSHIFDDVGYYPYYCSIHYQFMRGLVIVEGVNRSD